MSRGVHNWRAAAKRSLMQLKHEPEKSSAVIEQAVLSVESGGRRELVSLALRDGTMQFSCTDGRATAQFVVPALQAFASDLETGTLDGEGEPAAAGEEKAIPVSDVAIALQDFVTAVARNGVERRPDQAPAVEDALQRLVEAHANATAAPGFARWFGRLRAAFAAGQTTELARLLAAALQIAQALRQHTGDARSTASLVEWLGGSGHGPEIERLQDRTLVEIARQQLVGLERVSLQRRYLVDLLDGQIYREERLPGQDEVSVGGCPRLIHVGLAAIEPGVPPRRLRLLQYMVSLDVADAAWDQLCSHSQQDFNPMLASYRQALTNFPGLAEPFVVVAPRSILRDPALVLLDGHAQTLAIAYADDPGAAAALELRLQEDELRWIAGNLIDSQGRLLLVPASAAFLRHGKTVLWRAR